VESDKSYESSAVNGTIPSIPIERPKLVSFIKWAIIIKMFWMLAFSIFVMFFLDFKSDAPFLRGVQSGIRNSLGITSNWGPEEKGSFLGAVFFFVVLYILPLISIKIKSYPALLGSFFIIIIASISQQDLPFFVSILFILSLMKPVRTYFDHFKKSKKSHETPSPTSDSSG
jgi:hypothetical protein